MPQAAKPPHPTRVVTFKADAVLAALLESLPNKSEFIRRAVLAQAGRLCPLCRGGGMLSEKEQREFRLLLEQAADVPCRSCGKQFPWVFAGTAARAALSDEDRDRIQTSRRRGDFFCRECFRSTVACGSCGVHLLQREIRPHRRSCRAG